MTIQPQVNSANELAIASQNIMEIINKQQQIDKVQALLKLMEIYEVDINICGENRKVLNLEMISEYTGKDITKFMVKNEVWRESVRQVFHLKSIDNEKLVGAMDIQVMLKMVNHRRKGRQEIVNGLKNDVATAEIVPQNMRKKRFFGLM